MATISAKSIAPKKREKVVLDLPRQIVRGRKVVAVYREQKLPFYRGNPLIAALPAIEDDDTVIKRLTISRRDLEEIDQEGLIPEERLHLVAEAENFFQPLNHHMDLERRFARMIRQGYVGRNPVVWGYWKYKLDRVEEMMKNLREGDRQGAGGVEQEFDRAESGSHPVEEESPDAEMVGGLGDFQHSESVVDEGEEESDFAKRMRRLCSTALGFAILGLSGMGKSMAVEQILKEFYDQVIFHTVWDGIPFPHVQLGWLKLDCPSNGSLKSLCLHFFWVVDGILGTNYYTRYGRKGKASAEEMMPFVATVAMDHSLGVLVIDEIQNLSAAVSGGKERLINFLVELVNTIGVPIVLVGTNQAYHDGVFEKFREARRASGQGDKTWDRMPFYAKGSEDMKEEERPIDSMWHLFTVALWDLHFLRGGKPEVDPSSEYVHPEVDRTLSKALYDVSQGITFFAVKAYFLAQIRAIERANIPSARPVGSDPPPEELTEELFISVLDILRLASPMLDALRSPHENQAYLDKSTDIKPIPLSYYAEQAITHLQRAALLRARMEARAKTPSTPLHSTHGDEEGTKESTEGTPGTNGNPELNMRPTHPVQSGLPPGTLKTANNSAQASKSSRGTRSSKAREQQGQPGTEGQVTGKGQPNGNSQLANLVSDGQKQGLTGHETLAKAGIMYTAVADGEGQE